MITINSTKPFVIECEQHRFAAMPEQQTSHGLSSSVVIFLLLSTICCMLSLSSPSARSAREANLHHAQNGTHEQRIWVSNYVPNLAMICVMIFGITAMAILIFKTDNFTTDHQSANRHNLHRKLSLRGITAFFVGSCIFDMNYIIVEVSCRKKWTYCDDVEVVINNSFEMVFHIICVAFTGCETIVCWIMKSKVFNSSPTIWYGLAVVQAANVALWFDSVLKEWFHRVYANVYTFERYFNFCNTTSQNHSETGGWCSETSIEAQWFVWSSPFLFPITIEFALLVSETFLGKTMCDNEEIEQRNVNPNRPTENIRNSTTSAISKICNMMSVIINVFYLLLAILVFVGYKDPDSKEIEEEWQTIKNIYTAFFLFYLLLMIICGIVGIICCRGFNLQHTRTTFLEYLLLFSTCGVLFQCIKRLLAFSDSSLSDWLVFYLTAEIVDMIEVLLQIVLYYYAKDVKLPTNADRNAGNHIRIAVFKNIMFLMSVTNFCIWIYDSFFEPEMDTHLMPSEYTLETWPVFDNVVTPIAIFFRFNSALLFWCIYSDVSQPGTYVEPLLYSHRGKRKSPSERFPVH